MRMDGRCVKRNIQKQNQLDAVVVSENVLQTPQEEEDITNWTDNGYVSFNQNNSYSNKF